MFLRFCVLSFCILNDFFLLKKKMFFGYSWSTWKPRFLMDLRPLVKGRIANFGIFLDVFEILRFLMIFLVFQKIMVFGYSWSTLLGYRCYYPHRSRDALSPVCGIFPSFLLLVVPLVQT